MKCKKKKGRIVCKVRSDVDVMEVSLPIPQNPIKGTFYMSESKELKHLNNKFMNVIDNLKDIIDVDKVSIDDNDGLEQASEHGIMIVPSLCIENICFQSNIDERDFIQKIKKYIT